jgi:5,10-methylenetetrahydromethanopterin reductase
MFEVWNLTFPDPGHAVEVAVSLEQGGWDGMLLADSQNLTAELYATLGAITQRTSRLKFGPGVTNPVTRHVAVTASAAATLQNLSAGRFVLGVGRGDSAIAYLGLERSTLASFEVYLQQVQLLLRGVSPTGSCGMEPIQWLPQPDVGKVPVDVAASGPKAIAIAAVHGDRLSLMVGASESRLRWGIATAREARERAGLNPVGLSIGAYINCAAHPQRDIARQMVRGSLGTLLRFSAPPGPAPEGLAPEDAQQIQALANAYDMAHHAQQRSGHSQLVTDELIDKFAVVGPSNYCADRLSELVRLGLDYIIISGHSRDAPESLLNEAANRFAAEVLPALKRESGTSC